MENDLLFEGINVEIIKTLYPSIIENLMHNHRGVFAYFYWLFDHAAAN
jgi:hypothetical protein